MLDGELSGSFINDGAYTQVESGRRGGGIAFYYGVHRELNLTPSQVSAVKFRFRGGDRKLPITDDIMRRLQEQCDYVNNSNRHNDDSRSNDVYEEDSFVVGEDEDEEDEEDGGGHESPHDSSSSVRDDSSPQLLLLDGDSSFEL
jgi:hypothetical protein